MNQLFFYRIFMSIALGILVPLAGCGNEDGDDTLEADTNDDANTDTAGGTDTNSDGDSDTIGVADACFTLHLDLHSGSGQQFVNLSTMTVTGEDTTDYDFAMVNQMPAPPAIYLGPGAGAINTGSEKNFDDALVASDSGYLMDDGDTAVIGTAWQVGGTGQAGYEMSNDIYVIKTANGGYGKIVVTAAMKGQIEIDAFYQADGGTDLTCAYAE